MVNLVDPLNEDNMPTPNPLSAMLLFFVFTSIYCVVSLFISGSANRIGLKAIYFLCVVLGQYFINLSLSETLCGVTQWQSTLFITLVPWVLIFGVLHLFLTLFPGWLSPFSNTVGYGVAKLMGLPDLMDKILVKSEDAINNPASAALENVRSDKSLLVNELFAKDEKFNAAWIKLQKNKIIMPDIELNDNGAKKTKLQYFVMMKDTIAEYCWNLLTGILVTSISYNYIINTGCEKTPQEMKARYSEYSKTADIKDQANKNKKANAPNYTQTT